MKIQSIDKPIWIFPLVTFRVVFGFAGLLGVLRFWHLGWIADQYIEPGFHFHYQGFEWVEPLPASGMYLVFFVQAFSAIGIMLGAWYRISAFAYFVTFTYVELIDKAYYLNHYYFVSLAAFLLMFSHAHHFFSVDVWRKPSLKSLKVPAFEIWILMALIGIVYTYAGLAKINSAWLLDAQPLALWLPPHYDMPLLGSLMRLEFTPYLFSWAGMIFDSTIVAWLLWNRSRPFAYIVLVLFHVVTGYLFPIGMFPTIMSLIVLIFFSAKWHLKWQKEFISKARMCVATAQVHVPTAQVRVPTKLKSVAQFGLHIPWQRLKLLLFAFFLLFQLMFPWRYLLYPGNLFWTEDGYRFSWRVMLVEKLGHIDFYVQENGDSQKKLVYLNEWLNNQQIKQMSFQPDMILEFAHHMSHVFSSNGIPAKISAECYVTMNGKPGKLYFDPEMNLAEIPKWTPGYKWLLP